MKKLSISIFITLSVILLACSESSSPEKNAKVEIIAEISNPLVTKTISDDNPNLALNEVDSIKISRIRILMSRLKLYRDIEDTTQGREIKIGPFIYEVTQSGNFFVLAEGSVPAGIYDKLKFEFHRFSSSEATQFLNHPVFKDFANEERYSFIIDGIYYTENKPNNFTYRSKTTANLLLKFNPSLNLKEETKTQISLQINPNLFFKKSESILNPDDPKNSNDIDNAIQSSIKAIKK